MRLRFTARELLDFLVAWVALGLAFAFFFEGPRWPPTRGFLLAVAASLLTVGVGFLLHELAHKVVAVRFGQVAEFRADYGMLFLAVVGGLAGFIFAAPGAVHHVGRLSDRERGLIALAGPTTNLGLAVAFLPLVAVAPGLGARGVQINLLLAAFNMLPVGPLDGRTVLGWSKAAYAVVAVPAIALGVGALLL